MFLVIHDLFQPNFLFQPNLDGWFDLLSNILLFFGVLVLYYTNLNSSIICCLFSRDIYLHFDISVSSKLFCEYNFLEDFEALLILSAVLLPIKSPVASAVFLNCSFWSSSYCICCRFFYYYQEDFDYIYGLKFYSCF